MKYLQVVLTIILLLMLMQTIGRIWKPTATASSVTDVNLVQLSGREIGKDYYTSKYAQTAIPVRIVD